MFVFHAIVICLAFVAVIAKECPYGEKGVDVDLTLESEDEMKSSDTDWIAVPF